MYVHQAAVSQVRVSPDPVQKLIPGEDLSRDQLLDRVWGYSHLGNSRLVDVHVQRLRAKVEKDSGAPQLIITVRGAGYKLSLIHISEPTRLRRNSYAVFCLKKKKHPVSPPLSVIDLPAIITIMTLPDART